MNSFSTFFALLVFVIRLHKSKENSIVTSPFVQLIQDGKRATGSRSMVVLPLITLKSVLMRTERLIVRFALNLGRTYWNRRPRQICHLFHWIMSASHHNHRSLSCCFLVC
uniref:Secreted protein n=1 Tax=Globodera rostochiensis TaxID=31243 RepID=A0A914HUJ9_GLORO